MALNPFRQDLKKNFMRTKLQFQKKYNKRLAQLILAFSFIFSITSSFGQEIIINKTADIVYTSCSQFDMTLEIIGNPPPRPQEVVLVIDVSGSMDDGPVPEPIDYAKDAAVSFIDNFFLPANNPTGLNKVALVSFSNSSTLVVPLTGSTGQTTLTNAVNALVTGGYTNTEAGIQEADNELTNNGTFDCATSRSIILLSDGVATARNGGSNCSSTTTVTACQTEAIAAGVAAQTTNVSGTDYNQSVFTIGLIGAISGTEETVALSTLDQIQNAGAFSTEDNADLSGIYMQILGQLVAAATQLPGQSLVTDTIPVGFSLIAGTLNPSKGTATNTGQDIDWFVDAVYNETITLNYSIQADDSSICGDQMSGTTIIEYRDSMCSTQTLTFDNPEMKVPCPFIDAPTPLNIEGCDETVITALTARYPFSDVQSADIKDTYVDIPNGYLATVDVNIVSITYIDVITPSSSCPFEVTRTYTIINNCGNSDTAIQIINITDTTNPTFTVPADLTIECDVDHTDLSITGDVTDEDDGCSSGLDATYIDSVSNGSCDKEAIVTRTWSLTDDCGNTSTADQTITVVDTTDPTFTAPADLTIECDQDETDLSLTGDVTDEADNCDTNIGDATYSDSVAAGACLGESVITRTWSLTDDCGNTSTADQTITVVDTTDPTIDTPASDVVVECDGSGNNGQIQAWLDSNGGAVASDNCGTITWTNDYSGAGSDCSAPVLVTFTATDNCGNFATTSATYAIQDTTAPTIDVEASDMTVECDGAGNLTALNDWLNANGGASASDDCSAVAWSNDFTALSDDCGETGSALVTFTATDGCGNQSTTSATFTIEDTTDPTIDVVASDMTVECDGAGNLTALNDWLNSNGGASASDDCSAVTWTNDFTALSDDCGETGSALVTFTATDDCGNQSATSSTFTIEDTTDPTIDVVASDMTVECDGSGNITELNDWLNSNGGASSSDTCGNITWTNDYTALSDDCGETGTALVTFTATDDCGNAVTTSATFTIEDTTNPVLTIVASDQTVQCDGSGNTDELQLWLDTNAGAMAADDCSDVTWTNNFTGLTNGCGETGLALVTFTATDDCGNSVSSTALFTILDLLPPTIDTDASDLTVECDGSGNLTDLNDWLNNNGGATSSDICGNITWTNDFTALSDDCGATGSAVVIFTATDDCGNATTTSATFTIEDTTDPTFTVPADVTIECDQDVDDLTLTGDVTDENDNCSSGLEATYSDAVAPGACANESVITRTWTLVDDCGNTTTADQTISVVDTTDPTIDTPASDVVVECDGSGNNGQIQAWLDSNGGAVASDNCGTITWTNDYSGAGSDCSAPVLVTFTATDDCGNFSTTSATYAIQDTTAPTIDVEASDMTVECDGAGNLTALNDWLNTNGGASATDDCSAIAWSNDFTTLSDDCGETGSALVTFTATDGCGNQTSTSATFTIEDTTDPTIDVAASDMTVECDGSGNTTELNDWLNANGGASSFDTCGNITWTNDFTALSDDCGETGTALVTFTATDDCGNAVTTSATFTIEDTTAPTIDVEATDITVECDGLGNVDAFNDWLNANGGSATASDDCSSVTWTNNAAGLSDDCGETGSATVTFTATDDCGNSTTTSATFTIEDTTAPTIDVEATDITVECDGLGNVDAFNDWLNTNGGSATASDDCSSVTWTNSSTGLSDECGGTGSATVTFTATDDCGNSTSTTATFTIEDTTAPTIDVDATDITVECDGLGNVDAFNDWLNTNGGSATASDDCSSVTWTNSSTGLSDECGGTGSATVTFTATDDCGNSTSTTATFTIEDTTAPTIDVDATDITVECDGLGNVDAFNDWLNANGGSATASDDCSSVTWTNSSIGLSDECGGTGSATVTFTATDDCGNSTSTTATFTIVDTTAPIIDVDATDITVECDGLGNVDAFNDWLNTNGGSATASDDCSSVTWTNSSTGLSDECGGTGSATVTFTATDDCGNSTSTTATFTIEDTTAPTIDVDATDITVECDGLGNVDAFNDWLNANGGSATASDDCSSVTWTNSSTGLSDECGETGSATVTFTATDDCGNSTSTTATFTIVDTTAPTIDVEATDLTVECDGAGNVDAFNDWLNANGGSATVSDDCSSVTWTNDFTALSDDCGNTGSATVSFTATDECGNSSTTTATFAIVDTTAPVVVSDYDDEISVICSDIPEPADLVFEDACSTDISVEFNEYTTYDGTSNDYEITYEWIVTDECDNLEIYTQIIFVTNESDVIATGTTLCIEDSIVDLFDFLSIGVNSGGTWTVFSGNATLDGSLFDPNSVEVGNYVFNYTDDSACASNVNVTISIHDDCVVLACGDEEDVIISKAVTANGDQWNEYFTVGGIDDCGYRIEVQIFNRWGAKIYQSNNYQNNWNGFAHGNSVGASGVVPTGTYYYIVKLIGSGLRPFSGPIYVGTK